MKINAEGDMIASTNIPLRTLSRPCNIQTLENIRLFIKRGFEDLNKRVENVTMSLLHINSVICKLFCLFQFENAGSGWQLQNLQRFHVEIAENKHFAH